MDTGNLSLFLAHSKQELLGSSESEVAIRGSLPVHALVHNIQTKILIEMIKITVLSKLPTIQRITNILF